MNRLKHLKTILVKMKIKTNKVLEVFSIKKNKKIPFSYMSNYIYNKNRKLISLKEKKLEWEIEYHLIYNFDNIDNN
jgi:hypothetical protein